MTASKRHSTSEVTSPASTQALYFVPRSQVWEGSRGRQSGRVHLVVDGKVVCGRRRGWYERQPDGEAPCSRCVERAHKRRIAFPCSECGRDLHGYRGPRCRYCDGTAE